MARRRLVDTEVELAKQQLRSEAARARRSIDKRLSGLRREAARLTSWQAYVRQFPLASMLAAFGIGLLIARGPSPCRWPAWLGRRFAAAALAAAQAALWRELKSAFAR